MKPTTRAVLRALEAGPCTTHQLIQPDVGGGRFSARILELRELGYEITERRIRQGSHLYTLEGRAMEAAPTSKPPEVLPAASTAPSASLRSSDLFGPHHCCDACGHRWRESDWPWWCPNCHVGVHWVASFWTAKDADLYVPMCPAPRELAVAA